MPSKKNSTGEKSTGENSTEIPFKYNNSLHVESYLNWMFNCDYLYDLFVKTDQRDIADMNVLQRMERIKSFNSFLNEQIKKGKMKEIPFEYNKKTSWEINRDRLFKVFLHIHTNEIYDLHFFKKNELFNIFLKEQIEKGIMEPIPEKQRPPHMRRAIAKLERENQNSEWIETLNHKRGVPIPDKELKKEFGVQGFTQMPGPQETFASSEKPEKLIHPYHANTPEPVLFINHTSLGGLKKKKKTNKRRNKTNKRRNKRKQTKKRRRNT